MKHDLAYFRILGLFRTFDGRNEKLPLYRQAAVSDMMQEGLKVPGHPWPNRA